MTRGQLSDDSDRSMPPAEPQRRWLAIGRVAEGAEYPDATFGIHWKGPIGMPPRRSHALILSLRIGRAPERTDYGDLLRKGSRFGLWWKLYIRPAAFPPAKKVWLWRAE